MAAASMVQADLCSSNCTTNRPRRGGDGGRAHGGGASAEAAGVHKAQAAVVVAVEVLNTS